MAAGLAVLSTLSTTTPTWVLATMMMLVGLAGPLAIPPVTAVLLNSAPDHRAGTASGVFNTSGQIGGALAGAVFGALLSGHDSFMPGLRLSLAIPAAVAVAAAGASVLLRPQVHQHG